MSVRGDRKKAKRIAKRRAARRSSTPQCPQCGTPSEDGSCCSTRCYLRWTGSALCSGKWCRIAAAAMAKSGNELIASLGGVPHPDAEIIAGQCGVCRRVERAAKKYRTTPSWMYEHVFGIDGEATCDVCASQLVNARFEFSGVVDHHHMLHDAHRDVMSVRGVICNPCNLKARRGVTPEICEARAVGTGDEVWLHLAGYLRRTGWYDYTYGVFTLGDEWCRLAGYEDGQELIPASAAPEVSQRIASCQGVAIRTLVADRLDRWYSRMGQIDAWFGACGDDDDAWVGHSLARRQFSDCTRHESFVGACARATRRSAGLR